MFTKNIQYNEYIFVAGELLVRWGWVVGEADLAVGAKVCGGDLKGDLVVGLFAHLLGQKVGLSHKSVGFHDLLPEPREALAEQLISNTHTHTHDQHQETAQEVFV